MHEVEVEHRAHNNELREPPPFREIRENGENRDKRDIRDLHELRRPVEPQNKILSRSGSLREYTEIHHSAEVADGNQNFLFPYLLLDLQSTQMSTIVRGKKLNLRRDLLFTSN